MDPTTVDTYFTVELNGTVLTSADAASKFTDMSSSRLSAALGYEVSGNLIKHHIKNIVILKIVTKNMIFLIFISASPESY